MQLWKMLALAQLYIIEMEHKVALCQLKLFRIFFVVVAKKGLIEDVYGTVQGELPFEHK